MISTVLIYLKQRFGLKIFAGLGIFLFVFAKGNVDFTYGDFPALFILLPLLLIFRLFDDLQNREADRGKMRRIYTEPKPFRLLGWFLLLFTGSFLVAVLFFRQELSLVVLLFFLFNLLIYKMLFRRGRFRYLLPMLKYPFICLLLMFMPVNQMPAGEIYPLLLPAFSLLPAFLLFETLEDRSFPLPSSATHILFVLSFVPLLILPLLSGIVLPFQNLLMLFLIPLPAYLLCLKYRTAWSPYCLLVLLLLTRLLAYEKCCSGTFLASSGPFPISFTGSFIH